jgi:transcriptional regulator with XRE-family HTH domain
MISPMHGAIHSPEHVRLGRTVRELRARRGLSQEELGQRSGLHRNYVGAIERGEINPTFRVLLKLQRGLQLPLSEIVALWEERAHDQSAPQRRSGAGRGRVSALGDAGMPRAP